MKKSFPIIATLVLGIIIWTLLMWPLPHHFTSSIPLSERSQIVTPRAIGTVPCDHLQLLYHFWLAGEVLSGKIPLGTNPYEFNISDDKVQHHFDTHYIPFSFVYALIAPIFGYAAGWNCAGLFSGLIGLIGIFLLAKRYSPTPWRTFAVAFITSAFPYRWISLITGSPTGFATCLVPWIAYGIDRTIRDRSPGGSAIAGLALLLAFCADLHVFYFSALATPFFFAIPIIYTCAKSKFHIDKHTFLALIPFAIMAVAVILLSKLKSSGLGATSLANGRSFEETGLFSPIIRGLFSTQFLEGSSNSIFIGTASLVFYPTIVFCTLLKTIKLRERQSLFQGVAATLISLAVLATILLAVGANGPCNGILFRLARASIPKYTMIRQSAKIFCLLPTLLTMLAAICWQGSSRFSRFVLPILALAVVAQHTSRFHTIVTAIDNPSSAYVAAARDAAASGIDAPRAVVIPIWPGDSHFASIYELGIMNSRLRLVNGYSPSPPANYFDSVFKPLESLNQGLLTSEQVSLLKEMNVDYIIFHEDVFPDKVSPFPSGMTLECLAANPMLIPLYRGERTAAFKLQSPHSSKKVPNSNSQPSAALSQPSSNFDYAPSIVWNGPRIARSLETASSSGLINLAMRSPLVLKPDMQYLLHSPSNHWYSIAFDNPMGGEYPLPDSTNLPDLIFISAGKPIDGDSFSIVPSRMFHNGTSLDDGTVYLDTGAVSDRHSAIEGPFEPLPQGDWSLEIRATGACANDAVLEILQGVRGESSVVASVPFSASTSESCDKASINFKWLPEYAPFAFRVTAAQISPLHIVSVKGSIN